MADTAKPAFGGFGGSKLPAMGDAAKPAFGGLPSAPAASKDAGGSAKPAFGGFGTSSGTTSPFSFASANALPTAAPKTDAAPVIGSFASSTSSLGKPGELKPENLADMDALNSAFADWVAAQVKRDGVLDFSTACKKYIEYREEILSAAAASGKSSPFGSAPSAGSGPSFTTSSSVPKVDTSFFAKQSALPFAPKMPSPLTADSGKKDGASPFGASPFGAAPAPAAKSGDGDGDGDGEEEVDPEAAKPKAFQDDEERERPGEEDEENLFSKRCKLHVMAKDSEGKDEWKSMGFGEVRVNKFVKGPSEGKYRILVREESSTQKLVLNSFLLPTMQPKLQGKNKVFILAPTTTKKTDESGNTTEKVDIGRFLITLKTTDDCNTLIKIVDEHKPEKK